MPPMSHATPQNSKPFNYYRLSLLFVFLFIGLLTAYAQEADCPDAIEVLELPFEDSGNTSDYGDLYAPNDVPPLAPNAVTNGSGTFPYLLGDNAAYALTPLTDGAITVSLTHPDESVALWVFTGCPYSETVGFHNSLSGTSRIIEDLPVTAGETYYILISTWPPPQGIDYTIQIEGDVEIGEVSPCTQAQAGTPDETHLYVCADNEFTISVSGASGYEEGLTRIWQSSPAGQDNWTDLPGNSALTLYVSEGIQENTDYRFAVSCNDQTAVSDIIEIQLFPHHEECYCTPFGNNSNYFISNFTTTGGTENISNNSGSFSEDGYGNFTDMAVSQKQGYTIDFEVELSGGNGGGFRIWVDWNNNGELDPNTEVAYHSTDYGTTHSGTIEVPLDAAPGPNRMRIVNHFMLFDADIDPCVMTHFHGEFEDYTFNIIELEGCDGTPSAGTPAETQVSVCPNYDFPVSVEGSSELSAGLTSVWQSSPAGEEEWADVEGATQAEFIIENGIQTATDFRFVVTCANSGQTDISEVIQAVITDDLSNCYCTPGASDPDYMINSFITYNGTQNISNTGSGFSPGGYGDFTEMTVSQVQGESISFEASLLNDSAGFRIWIDWNKDGYFDPETEVAYSSTNYEDLHIGTIEIPEDTAEGPTIMRMASHWWDNTGNINPCETNHSYGEFEDYTFEVILLEQCEGTPSAGTPTENEISVCPDVAFSLSVEGATQSSSGLSRIWQSSPAGEEEWTDLEGAVYPEYQSDEGIAVPMDFRYKVYCENSDETTFSPTIHLTINENPTECYCIPKGTNPAYFINNFSTAEGNQNINNNDSGFSENGYGDFTDMTVSQLQNEAISFEADLSGGTAGLRIWIDWNQDGVFDPETEIAYDQPAYLNTHTGTIAVPYEALPGATRMRMQSHYYSVFGFDPCAPHHTDGEFEDYTFEVISLENCEGTPTAGTPSETEIAQCPGTSFTLSVEGTSDLVAGMTRTWQFSPAGENNWTDIEGADLPEYEISEGIEENTDYRYVVTCENSDETDLSEIIHGIVSPPTECYCLPEGSGPDNNTSEILNFSLSNLSHDTPPSEGLDKPGYSDYSQIAETAQLNPNVSYVASITTNTGSGNHSAAIWIDYNDDGIFDDSERVTYTPSAIGPGVTAYFPEFIVENYPGVHRLRVVYAGNDSNFTVGSSLYPCYLHTHLSEVEDYLVEILVLDECEGAPNAGVAMEDGDICANVPLSLSVTGASEYTENLVGQWQSSPAGQNDWTDVAGAYYHISQLPDGIAEPTDFRYVLACTTSGTSDTSNIVTFGIKDVQDCYCSPSATLGISYIPTFTTTGGLENISNIASPFAPFGYGDYTDQTVTQVKGESFDFMALIVELPTGMRIWIDWNQDGVFDPINEVVYASSVGSFDHYGTITIPEDALPGKTRMRIVNAYNNATADVDPCATDHEFGEFHDYSVMVLSSYDCLPPTNFSVDFVGDTYAFLTWDAGEGNAWEVMYGNAGFDPETQGQSVIINGNPEVFIEDLNYESSYEVYVRTLCVTGESSWTGPESMITYPEPPPYSHMCTAQYIEPNLECVDGFYTNVDAFQEMDEPTGSCLGDSQGTNSVWFTFEAPFSGEGTLIIDSNQSGFFTEMVVFEAPSDCTNMNTLGPEVACMNEEDELIFSDLTPGQVYYVRISGHDDLSGEFCITYAPEGPMSVDKHLFDDFSYYPNPVNNELTLKSGNIIENVNVYNLLGQQVMEVTPNNTTTQISTESLSSGTYMMKVSIDGAQRTFRIIKK